MQGLQGLQGERRGSSLSHEERRRRSVRPRQPPGVMTSGGYTKPPLQAGVARGAYKAGGGLSPGEVRGRRLSPRGLSPRLSEAEVAVEHLTLVTALALNSNPNLNPRP